MDRHRLAALSVLFTGLLTGCTEMRWCRDCCCCAGREPNPAASSPAGPKLQQPAAIPAASASLAIAEVVETARASAQPGDDIQSASAVLALPEATTLPLTVPPPPPGPSAPPALAPPALPPTTEQLPPLTAAVPAADIEKPLRTLHRRARQKFDTLNAYEMRIRRREVVGGQSKPEEVIQGRFRREPFSVYFRWIGPEAKGREVVYVQGRHGDLIHTLTAKDDVFLMPAGMRFKVAPDSPMAKGRSRTPITEAGLGSLIDRFGKLVDAVDKGDSRQGAAEALGAFKRTEFEDKVEGVMQTIPPGVEPLLPGGGQRLWCFDLEHGLPVLVVTHDHNNREVEYACHDRFAFPPHLGDEAFDPDRLWQK